MNSAFPQWHVDDVWLLPPSVHDLVPAGHIAHFVRDVVREGVDLAPLLERYEGERSAPAFHPGMMTALLLYAYSQGIHSSRQVAQACEERLDFAAVTGLQRPDARTIAEFRKRHLSILVRLFTQALLLCRSAGLPRLGEAALGSVRARNDGPTKRHRAADAGLSATARAWLATAAALDRRESRRRGADAKAQPAWLADRATRRARIREARATLDVQVQGSRRGKARKPTTRADASGQGGQSPAAPPGASDLSVHAGVDRR